MILSWRDAFVFDEFAGLYLPFLSKFSLFGWLQRFKEMREMHGSSSRDDRQKREQQRQEREMAKFAQMADAHKQQQHREEESGSAPVSAGTAVTNQDQRKALKFGFSSKVGTSKNSSGSAVKKPKVPVASVFGNDSDEE
ncbi:hypothetical protein LWI29_012049 [Acer saccharum]|uniref:Uncharacterized protein n=1 Tax=Acer saccharum TaxID=4024 RepID=A0AA39S6S4_ACESA|nr:hypothetical protein LWI29_012049 [Acer saccharum]